MRDFFFVDATFQMNPSLSLSPQVILSSMIKECEIKVENRGMADAQGWEQTPSNTVPFTASLPLKRIAKYPFLIACEAATATKAVFKENLQGEELGLLWGEGPLNGTGTGPVLWLYSPVGRGEHVRVLEPHSLCGYLHREGEQKMRGVVLLPLREPGQQPYCGSLLRNVSPILLTCVWGSLKREACLYGCKKCVYVCFVLWVYDQLWVCLPPPPPQPSAKLWG